MFPYSADLLFARFPLVAASPSRRRRMALPSEVVSSFIRTYPYMLIAWRSVTSRELLSPVTEGVGVSLPRPAALPIIGGRIKATDPPRWCRVIFA